MDTLNNVQSLIKSYTQLKELLLKKDSQLDFVQNQLHQATLHIDQLQNDLILITKIAGGLKEIECSDDKMDIMDITDSSILKSHSFHLAEVRAIIIKKDFPQLLFYKEFDLDNLFEIIIDVLISPNEDVQFHIIKNCINLELSDDKGWRLIHYVCNCSSANVLKYLISFDVKLNIPSSLNVRPIHIICGRFEKEIIRYFLTLDPEIIIDSYCQERIKGNSLIKTNNQEFIDEITIEKKN